MILSSLIHHIYHLQSYTKRRIYWTNTTELYYLNLHLSFSSRLLRDTEHDFGNSDYHDDDDDDDEEQDGDDDVTDGTVGGGYPKRVSSIPGFRCDTVLRPLGHRPDFVTTDGQVDGSGSSDVPRQKVTDRDQEEDEGATALDNSSASYGADSPSCSTLAHHTYTTLRSTQRTNSVSTLVQNRKVGERNFVVVTFSYGQSSQWYKQIQWNLLKR